MESYDIVKGRTVYIRSPSSSHGRRVRPMQREKRIASWDIPDDHAELDSKRATELPRAVRSQKRVRKLPPDNDTDVKPGGFPDFPSAKELDARSCLGIGPDGERYYVPSVPSDLSSTQLKALQGSRGSDVLIAWVRFKRGSVTRPVLSNGGSDVRVLTVIREPVNGQGARVTGFIRGRLVTLSTRQRRMVGLAIIAKPRYFSVSDAMELLSSTEDSTT